MKSAERPQPKTTKVKQSMSYFIVFEHLHGGLIRRGNYVIKMTDRIHIDDLQAIRGIERGIVKALNVVDPVIIDFKPLKMVKVE